MVAYATTLTVLIALFMIGIKLAIDVVREWPQKKSVSSHFKEQGTGRHR
jgi:hypothetical protein